MMRIYVIQLKALILGLEYHRFIVRADYPYLLCKYALTLAPSAGNEKAVMGCRLGLKLRPRWSIIAPLFTFDSGRRLDLKSS